MTQEEKHTIIAEFEGFRQAYCECEQCQKRWATGRPKEMVLTQKPDGWEGCSAAIINYDNVFANDEFQYSTDLNLCARVEAKIAGMELIYNYLWHLEKILEQGARVSTAKVFMAPPTARVDALVRLITTLKP
jgi:hypothetical protein